MKKKLLVFAALLVLALAVASVACAKDVKNGEMVTVDEVDDITSVGGIPVPTPAEDNWDWHQNCVDSGRLHFFVDVEGTTYTYFVYVAPDGHKWASASAPETEWGVVTTKPTCSTFGEATDQCTVCLVLDPTHTRPIDKLPHEYDDPDVKYPNAHIVTPYYKEPGCGEGDTGLARHACIQCGEAKPDEEEKDMVVIPKIPHDWTDWNIDESTCGQYGAASRTCLRCKATQYVDKDHPVVDKDAVTPENEQGKITIEMISPKKNPNWNAERPQEEKEFTKQSDLDAFIDSLKCEKTIGKNWLADCYTRKITYVCPYCHGEEVDTDYNGAPDTVVHKPFVVTLKYPATLAHDWCEEPEPFGKGLAEGTSLAPTCTTKGYYLTLCKHDAKHAAQGAYNHGHDQKDQYLLEEIPATDHDWSDWIPVDTFHKGDDWYVVSYRYCKNCGANETTNDPYVDPDIKQGLIEDEDGVWRLYKDGEVDTTFTDKIVFQGGEFWVVRGVVPPDANGLTICPDGKAYFLVAGQIQRVTQWAEYNGEWFVIKNGELDKVTGLLNYDGGTFAVVDGRKIKELNGLWCDPTSGKWAFIAGGQVATWFTGETTYDGHTFKIEKGYLAN